MSALTVQLLGTFEASHAEHKVTSFPRRKALALLAYLCVEQPGIVHQRDKLAAMLWPDTFQEDARRSLRQCLYELRQKLHDPNEVSQSHFEVTAQTVRLRTENLKCDVSDFISLCASDDPTYMESALNLYRGELLAGFNVEDAAPFEEWLFYVRGQLGRSLTQVLQHQREQAEQNQDWSRVIVALRHLITLDNLNEELYFALMQAYLANGERKTALDLYVEWRDLLETELQLAPQPQVTALYNKIRQSPAIQSNSATPPPESAAKPKLSPNLPTALTSLIGRAAEIQNIKELISRPHTRLLTLTGAGGSGKTRLAIEVARELYPDFQAGVYFIALATLNESSPEQIAATIANTLGLKESADTTRVQQLMQHLRSSQM
jgi:DNA-binding SARP family transcriptional activator